MTETKMARGMPTASEPVVVLTAHPLQRVGAFSLAALVDAADPERMTQAQFNEATCVMRDDVVATASVADSKAEGGFWLGVSYLMWPNSKMNPTARKKLTTGELREQIRAWRTYPDTRLGVPCALCGRPACGFFGKVDVPLGASTEHRNTTPPGHGGLALCPGCLASFHALPYGCEISGGKAAALHSWDDEFLRRTIPLQVERTQRGQAVSSGPGGSFPYTREARALRRLRAYEEPIRAGVELMVFSNSNREQTLDAHALEQPLAEWLRSTMRDDRAREGFRYLVRAHWTEKIPGSSLVARNAFRNPVRIVQRAIAYLADVSRDVGGPPAETQALADLSLSFIRKVLQVKESDVQQITELADKIAGLIAAGPEAGRLKQYEAAQRDPRQLQAYLKRKAVDWTLRSGADEPLVTAAQWRLLFDPDGQGWFHRDVLLMSVLQSLAARKWRPNDVPADDPAARASKDDTFLDNGEDQ